MKLPTLSAIALSSTLPTDGRGASISKDRFERAGPQEEKGEPGEVWKRG